MALSIDDIVELYRTAGAARYGMEAVNQEQPGYWETLSPASRRSLELQGGVFSAEQARRFIAEPFDADAVALRRWDDCAKDPSMTTPGWAHYRTVLRSASMASAIR